MTGPKAHEIGRLGEDEALRFLKKNGYRVLSRNWKTPRYGEIDIVAEEKGTLVFVEVKSRTSLYSGAPSEAVNFYKFKSLRRAALYFKQLHPETPDLLRLDVISVLFLPGRTSLEHFKSVYEDPLT